MFKLRIIICSLIVVGANLYAYNPGQRAVIQDLTRAIAEKRISEADARKKAVSLNLSVKDMNDPLVQELIITSDSKGISDILNPAMVGKTMETGKPAVTGPVSIMPVYGEKPITLEMQKQIPTEPAKPTPVVAPKPMPQPSPTPIIKPTPTPQPQPTGLAKVYIEKVYTPEAIDKYTQALSLRGANPGFTEFDKTDSASYISNSIKNTVNLAIEDYGAAFKPAVGLLYLLSTYYDVKNSMIELSKKLKSPKFEDAKNEAQNYIESLVTFETMPNRHLYDEIKKFEDEVDKASIQATTEYAALEQRLKDLKVQSEALNTETKTLLQNKEKVTNNDVEKVTEKFRKIVAADDVLKTDFRVFEGKYPDYKGRAGNLALSIAFIETEIDGNIEKLKNILKERIKVSTPPIISPQPQPTPATPKPTPTPSPKPQVPQSQMDKDIALSNEYAKKPYSPDDIVRYYNGLKQKGLIEPTRLDRARFETMLPLEISEVIAATLNRAYESYESAKNKTDALYRVLLRDYYYAKSVENMLREKQKEANYNDAIANINSSFKLFLADFAEGKSLANILDSFEKEVNATLGKPTPAPAPQPQPTGAARGQAESPLVQLRQEFILLKGKASQQLTSSMKQLLSEELTALSKKYSNLAVQFSKNYTYTSREVALQNEIENLSTQIKDILK